jgi:hypothetical protein
VLYRRSDVERLRDHLYVLEAALQDARMDLAESGRLEDYPAAFRTVAAAADELLTFRLEPQAIG